MKKFFTWTPRIISILFVGLIFIFALESFSENVFWGQRIQGFLFHLLPAFGVGICLLVAWRYPLLGGLLCLLLGAIFTIIFGTYNSVYYFLLIIAPIFIAGIMFMVSHLYVEENNKRI